MMLPPNRCEPYDGSGVTHDRPQLHRTSSSWFKKFQILQIWLLGRT